MRRPLLLVLLLFVVFVSAAQGAEGIRVRHVVDGDTVILENGEHVRLRGIDAPEIGREGKPDAAFAVKARDALRRLSLGEIVLLSQDTSRDRYGRILAWVKLENGRTLHSLNREMVLQGLALVMVHPDSDPKETEILLQAQHEAITMSRGFWPTLLRAAQEQSLLVGNISSKRVHTGNCPQGKRIARRNLVRYRMARDAFLDGMSPARNCFNWPQE